MDILKVSSNSRPVAVAGAIAAIIKNKGCVEIQTVGAGALNQGIKAIAIARGYTAPVGLELICTPSFVDVEIDGIRRTAIKLIVEQR